MKTFQSKSLLESRTVGLLKGLTLLFLWASVAVLATYGLTIDPGINNATQYIQKIILTSDGSNLGTTGIVLDGSGVTKLMVNGLALFNGWMTVHGSINWLQGLGFSNDWGDKNIWFADFGNNNLNINAASTDDGDTWGNVVINWWNVGGNVILSNLRGNVGVGTGSPTAKLTVQGWIKPISKSCGEDPCWGTNFPSWTIFYNSYIDTMCYCNASSGAVTMTGWVCSLPISCPPSS